jgi:hypothetical protein
VSQTTKALKVIASGEDYGALAAAIESVNYEAMFSSYMGISELLEKDKQRIEEGIKNLPVQNRQEHQDKFQRAFELAIRRILPLWHELDSQLKSGLAMTNTLEGEVFGSGKKGDPLVKTPEGVIVVLTGSKLEIGERVRFRVVQQTDRLSFGRALDLNAQSFYMLITQEAREKVRDSLALIGQRLSMVEGICDEDSVPDMGEILRDLRDAMSLSTPLQAEERKRIAAQVSRHRKTLLFNTGVRLMYDSISKREEMEIEGFYRDGDEQRSKALMALGLFRRCTYDAARQQLFRGGEPEGYAEILNEMSDKLDSMDSAVEYMEFKSAVDDVYPRAKEYIDKMDRVFSDLDDRLRRLIDALSHEDVADPGQLRLAIEEAFSEELLFAELRRAFRTSKNFLSSRGTFMELNRKLKNEEALSAEAAFKPYLHHKISQVFGTGRS